MTLRLLDLFCCEGGAARGYAAAGFEVVGVDIERRFRKRYPFDFVRADAVEYVKEHGHEFDAIHASPPCQHASAGTRALDRSRYPTLIEPTRDALIATGKPYVIENVSGAALQSSLTLCGSMFGLTAVDDDGELLRLERHRLFESSVPLFAPMSCRHDRSVRVGGSYGGGRNDKYEAQYVRRGGYVPSARVQATLLGIEPGAMTQHGLHQSLPPIYTRHLGEQLLRHVSEMAA